MNALFLNVRIAMDSKAELGSVPPFLPYKLPASDTVQDQLSVFRVKWNP